MPLFSGDRYLASTLFIFFLFTVPSPESSIVIRGCYNSTVWSSFDIIFDSGDCMNLDEYPAQVAANIAAAIGENAVSDCRVCCIEF